MTLAYVHQRLSVTATWFVLLIGIWALVLWLTKRNLGPAWFGAAIIAELLLVLQGLLGLWLFLGTSSGEVLTRPFLHILYGLVAVISIPAAWGYFGNLPEERVKSLAMALVFLFLWGIINRSGETALLPAPY